MTEDSTQSPDNRAPDTGSPDTEERQGVGGKFVVIVILVLIGIGSAAWFAMDHGRDVLDKGTGSKFAAAFEKECEPQYGRETCRRAAGENHSRCLRESASQTDAGIAYDREVYLTCLRDALDSIAAPQ